MVKKIISLALLLILAGCSVVTAASGSKEPDFNKIKTGTDEDTVNAELGEPYDSNVLNGTKINTYSYKLGDKPAPGRAVMHGVLDVCTLFLWEYIAFPMEISKSGNSYKAEVVFNDKNEVVKVTDKIK